MTDIALTNNVHDVIAEYNHKLEQAGAELDNFEQAAVKLKDAACIRGTWGDVRIDTGYHHKSTIEESLKKSAWKHLYKTMQLERIATAQDKRKFDQSMNNPPEFNFDNIKASFGDYIQNPWDNILRGLAETFCGLDQAYKSHEKVKIGVKGLPKRVIISGFHNYSSWGEDKVRDILNALAAYQSKPLVNWNEVKGLVEDGESMRESRGVWLKTFGNGNGHLFFDKKTLNDINKALADFYGDVLPDSHGERPTEKQSSTAVSKDLQYYPTPQGVIDRIFRDINVKGDKVLEPSCGCGRIMEAARKGGALEICGVEFDAGRAAQAREKGFAVMVTNFLETVPTPTYDRVIMNPPFYGKHYAKHVEHAFKFLKEGGFLTAILPASARYDHGLLTGEWSDLPLCSFKESGTNVNTVILTMRKRPS